VTDLPTPLRPEGSGFLDRRPLIRNIGVLLLSRGITLFAGVVITAWLGRKLGPESYGIIGFALAVVSYFALVVGAALEIPGARDVARHGARVRIIASHIFTLRLVLAGCSLVALALFIVFLQKPLMTKMVIAVHGMWLVSIAFNLDFVYQGRARMGMIALREISVSLLTLAGIVIAIERPDQVFLAATIMMIAMLSGAGLVFARCRLDYGAPVLRGGPRVWKRLLWAALPLAATGALVTAYRNIDMVLLGFLRPAAEVGLYVAAFKFFTTAMAPTVILGAAFTPVLSAVWGRSSAEIEQSMRQFAGGMALLLAPVAAIGFVFAPEALRFLFGDSYSGSATAVRILMIAVYLAGIATVYRYPLLLWRQERRIILPFAAAAAVNGAMNAFLIPRYGIEGAAVSVLAAEMVLVLWCGALQLGLVGRIPVVSLAVHAALALAAAMTGAWLVDYVPRGILPGVWGLLTGPLLAASVYGIVVLPLWWRRLFGAARQGK
jgi:O-antigen/teichoic acid export membrane protein